MGGSTDAAAGGRRGGRTVSKSTDEVMELACGLPLTRSVLRSVVAGATRPARRAGRPVQGRERQRDRNPGAPG